MKKPKLIKNNWWVYPEQIKLVKKFARKNKISQSLVIRELIGQIYTLIGNRSFSSSLPPVQGLWGEGQKAIKGNEVEATKSQASLNGGKGE